MDSLNLAMVIIPILGGIGVVVIGGFIVAMWNSKDKALEEALKKRKQLLEGQVVLRTENEQQWVRAIGKGQTPEVDAGTASTRRGRLEAIEAHQAAAHSFYGQTLLAEPDDSSRQEYMNSFAKWPSWIQKVTEGEFPLILGGLLGKSPSEVETLKPYWERYLREYTHTWLDHVRSNDHPVDLWVKVSPGGSGKLAEIPIDEFSNEYPEAPVYVDMTLDEGDDRRADNLPELLDLYAAKATGMLLFENRRHRDIVDQAIARLRPGMITARWVDERAKAHHDVWADIFRHHKIATVRVFEGKMPVKYDKPFRDKLGPVYYSPEGPIEKLLLQGVLKVRQDPRLQSVPIEPADSGPWFIYGILPVRPDPDLRKIATAVRSDLGSVLNWNTTLGISTVGHPFTPTTTEVSVFVVAVFPLQGNIQTVKDYITEKVPVDPKFIDPSISFNIGGNHHAGHAEAETVLASTGH